MTAIVSKPALSERSKFIRRLLKRKTVAFGLIVLTIFVLLAIFATYLLIGTVGMISKYSILLISRHDSHISVWFVG